MAPALTGQTAIHDYYQHAIARVEAHLRQMEDDQLEADSADELAARLCGMQALPTLTRDPDRPPTSRQERETKPGPPDFITGSRLHELRYAVIEYPLIPHPNNLNALRCRGSTWPAFTGIEKEVDYRERDGVLVLRTYEPQVEQQLGHLERMLTLINEASARHLPEFRSRVLELVRARRHKVVGEGEQFAAKMAALGITVQRKPGAVDPVDVRVRTSVQVMRAAPPRLAAPAEPRLNPASLDEILRIIDLAGKGFEKAPTVYGRLHEEDLRTIIIGYLNAIFDCTAATGETFSNAGKADILLNVPVGAVLIAECLIWGGSAYYQSKIEQVFGYLTWRHTAAVLITFSHNRGLSGVVAEADKAATTHPSYRRDFAGRTDTYRVSTHERPADPAKTAEIHHLLFDLHAAKMGSGAPRRTTRTAWAAGRQLRGRSDRITIVRRALDSRP